MPHHLENPEDLEDSGVRKPPEKGVSLPVKQVIGKPAPAEEVWGSPPYNTKKGGRMAESTLKRREISVRTTIAARFHLDVESVQRDTHLICDLRADENDLKEIYKELEEEFKIKFLDEDKKNLRIVGLLINYVQTNAKSA